MMTGIPGRSSLAGTTNRGFTLIELLIVVAIIAILAAIAVPNFLEAQTRAKVSRTKADQRTVVTALESYAVDANRYPPNDGDFNIVPVQLSTPVAYLTSTRLLDPFKERDVDPVKGELVRYLTYTKFVTFRESQVDTAAGFPPPLEAVDMPGFNPGCIAKHGHYQVLSYGPDRKYSDAALFPTEDPRFGFDVAYDPTNGTVSFGNVYRTERTAEGKR